ncbi:MAG: type II toxin-antitoxin system VapC family toxin [Candidatus Hydrogenedentes bacterium]|nr:type II toxin-antitoxin system VapC family toxin [Candidatus Hydrogenedentota bacterium]
MTGYLLDTHVWLWHVGGFKDLPKLFRETLSSDHSRCWLSPISVWELGILVDRGRITLEQPLRRWVAEAAKTFPVREAPLTREIALKSIELELPHRDPADRFIAATALVYGLTLITCDRVLMETDWLPILKSGG